MKKIIIKSSVLGLALATFTGLGGTASAGVLEQMAAVANGALPAYGQDQMLSVKPELTDKQIAIALREALTVAAGRVGARAADKGYLVEGELKMPSELRKPSSLRKVGKLAGKQDFELLHRRFDKQMQEAVLTTAPFVAELVKMELRSVEIVQPRVLLVSYDTAATSFLRSRTEIALRRQLQPVAEEMLIQSGAIDSAALIASKIQFGDLLERMVIDYAVDHSINGFFYQMEIEERAIRADPDYRSTRLLSSIFQ